MSEPPLTRSKINSEEWLGRSFASISDCAAGRKASKPKLNRSKVNKTKSTKEKQCNNNNAACKTGLSAKTVDNLKRSLRSDKDFQERLALFSLPTQRPIDTDHCNPRCKYFRYKIMKGHSCMCCEDYYNGLSLSPDSKRERINQVSRHRHFRGQTPTGTPPSYWDLVIGQTKPVQQSHDSDADSTERRNRQQSPFSITQDQTISAVDNNLSGERQTLETDLPETQEPALSAGVPAISVGGGSDISGQSPNLDDSNVTENGTALDDPRPLYVCSKCGHQATNGYELKNHRLEQHGITCLMDCGRSFRSERQMLLHVQKAHGDAENATKPYVCNTDPLCNKAFKKKYDFLRHLTTHDKNSKPFSCTVDGCTKTFGRKEHLSDHVRRCSAAVIQCTLCEVRGKSAKRMAKHFAHKHGFVPKHLAKKLAEK